MNYKNKLMGLSLIIVAMFSACSDEVENAGRDSGTGDHRITFAVSTQNQPNGTRSAFTSETHELGSVKMEGKLDGKPVYLTAEISDGFPGDNQPLTRGTQVSDAKQVDEFAVSATTQMGDFPDVLDLMYNVKVTKNNASSGWSTETPYYWPIGKKLNFFAWYPYQSKNLTVPKENVVTKTHLFYEVPEQVADQEDFMMANSYQIEETNAAVSIRFEHMLTAVKFKTSDDFPACTIKSITLKGLK